MQQDEIDRAASIYTEMIPLLESTLIKTKNLLEEILVTNTIPYEVIEGRVKKVESFKEKISRQSKNYENPIVDVTDLCGLRIVVYNLGDVKRVESAIRREFIIDVDNSIDKSKELNDDEFGYLSMHFIVKLSNSRTNLLEWACAKNIKIEIQVRTILQHAWAVIDHKLRYKRADEVPSYAKRKLYRLSALLELADEEFDTISHTITSIRKEYERKIVNEEFNIEINKDSIIALIVIYQPISKLVAKAIELKYRTSKYSVAGVGGDVNNLLKVINELRLSKLDEMIGILNENENLNDAIINEYKVTGERNGFVPVAIPADIIAFILLHKRAKNVSDLIYENITYTDEIKKTIKEIIEKEKLA